MIEFTDSIGEDEAAAPPADDEEGIRIRLPREAIQLIQEHLKTDDPVTVRRVTCEALRHTLSSGAGMLGDWRDVHGVLIALHERSLDLNRALLEAGRVLECLADVGIHDGLMAPFQEALIKARK